jgi:hypothetical protein
MLSTDGGLAKSAIGMGAAAADAQSATRANGKNFTRGCFRTMRRQMLHRNLTFLFNP